mgnify:CR=1 FL=1
MGSPHYYGIYGGGLGVRVKTKIEKELESVDTTVRTARVELGLDHRRYHRRPKVINTLKELRLRLGSSRLFPGNYLNIPEVPGSTPGNSRFSF